MNLFALASDDYSIQFLGQIFGTVGTLLPTTTPSPVMLAILFGYLNGVALTIAVFVIIYTVVISVINTATDGEILGKKYNLWTFIRIIIGTVFVFPINHGYSLLQVAMMWIIIQGIGAADNVWITALGVYQQAGSIYGGLTVSKDLITPNMKILFANLACQAAAKKQYPYIEYNNLQSRAADATNTQPFSTYWYCNQTQNDGGFCQRSNDDMLNILSGSQAGATTQNGMVNNYAMGPNASGGYNGTCGSLTFCDEYVMCNVHDANNNLTLDQYGYVQPIVIGAANSLDCMVCQAQKDTLMNQIVPTLATAGDSLASYDNDYAAWMNTLASIMPDFTTPNGTVRTGVQYYPSGTLQTPTWITQICNNNSVPINNCTPVGYFNNYQPYKDNDTGNADTSTVNNVYTPAMLSYGNVIDTVTGQYVSAVQGAYNNWLSSQVQSTTTTDWVNSATRAGWIEAGMYYYQLARTNTNNSKSLNLTFNVVAPDSSSLMVSNTYRNNTSAATDLITGIQNATQANQQPSGSSPSMPSIAGPVTDTLKGSGASLLSTFMSNMTSGSCQGSDCSQGSNTNPLVSISTYGYQLMITAQVLFAAVMWPILGIIIATTFTIIALGTGPPVEPLGEGAKALLNIATPIFAILLTAMYTVGATLGIYVPLIPYIIFIMGAVGWMVTTVEALAAAPLIGLGIMMPSGQHELLGKAEHAFMLMLNLFLRPSLMIIGLMAALFVAIPAVELVNNGFKFIATSVISAPGLFEQILFMGVYASLIVSVLNKVFSLIYLVPERILTWIGGPAVQYGEAEALQGAKGAVEGGAQATVATGKATGAAGAGGAVRSIAEKAQKNKKNKEAGATGAKPS